MKYFIDNCVCRPPEDTKQDEFVKEVQALKSLHHPKLIQLLAMCSRGEPVYIVTELMRKGSLKSYLACESSNTPSCVHLRFLSSLFGKLSEEFLDR